MIKIILQQNEQSDRVFVSFEDCYCRGELSATTGMIHSSRPCDRREHNPACRCSGTFVDEHHYLCPVRS